MSGNILAHPPIAIDYWKSRYCTNTKLFFLTHFHSDHTVGLNKSWNRRIYCSPVTRKLVIDQLQLEPDQVFGLELNEAHCLTFDGEDDKTLTVTPIDANHCPGAVMFLFEGYFGRILYTGDFRYSQSLNYEKSFSQIFETEIDELYLDNTFCSSKCCFPSREKVLCDIVNHISNYPNHRVMIGLRKLGKESLLLVIAKQLHLEIYVDRKRHHLLEILEIPNVFTTVESNARIHVVDQAEIIPKNMDSWNHEMPTIAIIPTAIYSVISLRQSLNERSDVFVFPYSDHSSYTELHEFVSLVQPRTVIPILKDEKDRLSRVIPERLDMSCFEKYLDKSPRSAFCQTLEISGTKRSGADHFNAETSQNIMKRPRNARQTTLPKGVIYGQISEEEPESANRSSSESKLDRSISPEEEAFANNSADSTKRDLNKRKRCISQLAEMCFSATTEMPELFLESLDTVITEEAESLTQEYSEDGEIEGVNLI